MMNRYIEPIFIKKKRRDFKAWKKKKSLFKYMRKLSPSFDDMMEIYEFLNILREAYMYTNSDKFHLFLGQVPVNKGYVNSDAVAMIYKEESFQMTFILANKYDRQPVEYIEGIYKDDKFYSGLYKEDEIKPKPDVFYIDRYTDNVYIYDFNNKNDLLCKYTLDLRFKAEEIRTNKSIKYNFKKMINIEIKRNGRSKEENEIISFEDGTYQFKDYIDEEKMLYIVTCLMRGTEELIEYYYKNKRL